jgi:hypothetical protein
MIIRVVCEGSTDSKVLGLVVRAVLKEHAPVVTAVQPNFDALGLKPVDRPPGTLGPGWQGVRAYLKGPTVTTVAALCDVLVVQVDADIRRVSEIETKLRKPSAGEHDLDPLCEHVKSWFVGGVPPNAIMVLPREAIEAWLLAVTTRITDVESDLAPAAALKTRQVVGTREGAANKQAAIYDELAKPLVGLIADRRRLARVPELERFVDKLRSRAQALRRAKKAGRPI